MGGGRRRAAPRRREQLRDRRHERPCRARGSARPCSGRTYGSSSGACRRPLGVGACASYGTRRTSGTSRTGTFRARGSAGRGALGIARGASLPRRSPGAKEPAPRPLRGDRVGACLGLGGSRGETRIARRSAKPGACSIPHVGACPIACRCRLHAPGRATSPSLETCSRRVGSRDGRCGLASSRPGEQSERRRGGWERKPRGPGSRRERPHRQVSRR